MAAMTVDQVFEHALQLHRSGRLPEAAAAYRQVLTLRPDFAEAHNNLASALMDLGQTEEALAACRRALDLNPNLAEAHVNLANALTAAGRPEEAVISCRRALALTPNNAEACNNLGNALGKTARPEAAQAAYRQALAIRPDFAEARCNLGASLAQTGRLEEAIIAFREALSLQPDYAAAASNLGAALTELARPDESIAACRTALAANPADANALSNLGNALKDAGRLDEAVASYRRAIALKPGDSSTHSNLLYSLQFHPGYDEQSLFREQRRWNELHALPLQPCVRPHGNDRALDRRLKVGYVSAEFYSQAESFFIVPLLERHDHKHYEIHCYSSVLRPDHLTAHLNATADVWHDVREMSDADLAGKIRDDRIDVLVDLAMHMSHNRMLAFARKPAPVQIAWLAYPGGTGLDAMDYRITDAFMDPPELPAGHYREQSVRLGDCWCCYSPLCEAPAAPKRGGGPIRFGSINNPCKNNSPLLKLWARVMNAVPDSRLIIQTLSREHQNTIVAIFESAGIAAHRIEFVQRKPRAEYLRIYDCIDICLDPLPYNGITTTCDALWMGVPVVTLAGKTAAGRAGTSILSTVGLPELIAKSEDAFVNIAVKLAHDPARLAELHATLRQKMVQSPLMDAAGFTRKMEAAYRDAWQRWCAAKPQ
jgi:protein O-GlcNAc transferase